MVVGEKTGTHVFKLDTVSGTTWIFEAHSIDYPSADGSNVGIYSDGWRELGPWDPENSANDAARHGLILKPGR